MTLCGTDDQKKKITARLNRIEGQVRGIRNMIEEERSCSDVLSQVAATCGAMKALSAIMLENHLTGCVSDAIRRKDSGSVVLKDLVRLFGKFSA